MLTGERRRPRRLASSPLAQAAFCCLSHACPSQGQWGTGCTCRKGSVRTLLDALSPGHGSGMRRVLGRGSGEWRRLGREQGLLQPWNPPWSLPTLL